MSISYHSNNVVSIKRLQNTTGYKKEHVTITDSLCCHIQPLSAEMLGSDGILGRDYLMFTSYQDIQELDRVIDQKGYEYRVQGVEKFDFMNLSHIEVRLRINDQPDK